MQHQIKDINKKSHLFFYLFILTFFFILLELGVFIEGSEFYLGDYKLVARHLKIPVGILPDLIYFGFVLIGLHIAYVFAIALLVYLISIPWGFSASKKEKIGIFLWVVGISLILLVNQYYFPNTKFSSLTYIFVKYHLINYLIVGFSSIFLFVSILALYGLLLLTKQYRWLGITLVLFLISAVIYNSYTKKLPLKSVATETKPNIFIIGIDALRPDFLSYFGSNLNTTHFDRFLNHATVFTESMTPLARTYPAWMSILTGLYPKLTDIRTDLDSRIHYDLRKTLPAILRKNGYETIYATDEVRFSNIDLDMGFDRLVTPPIGFNDFLLGSLNDFPMSNLLVNTRIGRYLFPYSYGNRAVYITYNPNTFLQRLKPILQEQRTKPLFFAVHFCLSHYPYSWASYPNNTRYLRNYRSAIQRVDQQFYDFMKLLQQNKLLQRSIVILLSDHGEAIELSGDRITEEDLYIAQKPSQKHIIPRFYPPSVKAEKVNQSAGHGTDVLGFSQYHNVLAVRYFGLQGQKENRVTGIVSLLDIKPTLFSYLNINESKGSGQSLIPYISGLKSVVPTKDFFFESDFSPEAVRSVHPETRKLLFQGIDYFEVNEKTTRLTVKKSMSDLIVSSKQFADLYGSWVLALYPQKNKVMTPILVNLETGFWTNNLQTHFAKHSPAQHMLRSLREFYGSDIVNIREGE